MKNMLIKAAALVSAAVLCMASAGCAEKDSDHEGAHTHFNEGNMVGNPEDGENLAEEAMPYGATMTSLKCSSNEKLSMDVDFDARYFAEENGEYPEIYMAADYLKALQNCDSEALEKLFYKPFLQKLVEDRGCTTTQEYLDQYHDKLMDKTNGLVVEFTYMTVDTCLNENESNDLTEFDSADAKLDEAAGEKISDKVKSRKLIYMDVTFSDSEGNSHQLNNYLGYDLSVYIYNIDGTYYLI